MARLTTGQSRFTMLVAHISSAGDPSRGINPTVDRSTYTTQFFPQISRPDDVGDRKQSHRSPGTTTLQGLLDYTVSPIPDTTLVSLTVDDNDFTNAATLYLGPFVLVSNEDYTPGANVNATAAVLAAAIDALPGFTAAAVAATITITGPVGLSGNDMRFSARYGGSVQNLTLTPTTGFLTGGEPTIGHPILT